jgi:hypothetical protein
MSRQARLIVVLLAFGVIGTVALSFVAGQYRKRAAIDPAARTTATGALKPDVTEDATVRTAREVDGFLAARVAAQGVRARYGDRFKEVAGAVTGNFEGVAGKRMATGLDVISTYKIERSNALTAHGMAYDDYAAVRAAWRNWSSGAPGGGAAWAAAFERRRGEAEKAGLGEDEGFDDAIK